MGAVTKISFVCIITFLLLALGANADCASSLTWTRSVTPNSDKLEIDSLSRTYDNFVVEWVQSSTKDVEVTANVCADTKDNGDNLVLVLDNLDGAVRLKMSKQGETETEVTTSTTAGGPDKGVYPSSASRFTPSLFSLLLLVVPALFVSPKKHISAFLVLFAIVLLAGSNTATADGTSTVITLRVGVPDSINTICISGQCSSRNGGGDVSSYVSLFGVRFAALDGESSCDASKATKLPSGWSIASSSSEAILAVYLHDWKTDNILLSDVSYKNNQYKATGANTIVTSDAGYKVSACNSRILITQRFPVPDATKDLAIVPSISKFLTFDGHDYGVADNVAYTDSSSTTPTAVYIASDSAWTVAPDDVASKIVLGSADNSFGSDCLYLDGGKSYSHDAEACSSSDGVTSQDHNGGKVYVVASGVSKRVLLRRTSSLNDSIVTTAVLNNKYFSGNNYVATLDNADHTDSTTKCQARYMAIPSGWNLATKEELTATMNDDASRAWTATPCIVASGLSLDHKKDSCSAKTKTVTYNSVTYYQTTSCARILISLSTTPQTDFTMGLKILLLSATTTSYTNDVQLPLALTMLNATGAAYDWLHLRSEDLSTAVYSDNLPLTDEQGNPKYYAIVLTDNQLSYIPTGAVAAVSAFTTKQQQQVNVYKRTYGIRLVALTSYPTTAMPGITVTKAGYVPINSGDSNRFIRFDSAFVTANSAVLGGIVTTAAFNISDVYIVETSTSGSAVPVVRYTSGEVEPTTSDSVAAAIITRSDNTNELHFFYANSIFQTNGPLFSSMWLNWVTKGIWLGNRRVYFIPQVDDLLLSTEAFDNQAIANRITGDDLRKSRKFLDEIKVPAGSTMTLEFGINGSGDLTLKGKTDELAATVLEMVDKFFWESHTYTHLSMTCPFDDCKANGITSYDACYGELKNNIDYFEDTLFKTTGKLDTPTFSKYCMITPSISGLFNANALKALVDNDIVCVVGDNSQPKLIPENLYHGLLTTKDFNGGDGVFIIPRFATEIYYDVAYPASEVIEYNTRYGLQGTIKAFPYNSTLDQILEGEGAKTARMMTLFRHDPYMFHQANLAHFQYARPGEDSKEWSLITLWIQSVVDHYNKYMNLPLLNVMHDKMWEVYKRRMASDACGTVATMTVKSGSATNVAVTSTGACQASITGLSSCGSASGCTVETYGPDTTIWATMAGNNAGINLPASLKWSN